MKTFEEWAQKFNNIAELSIAEGLRGHDEGLWHEDFITAKIIQGIKKQSNFVLKIGNGFKKITWNALKFNGKLENTHGDVAVIIRTRFGNGATLEGVAYLEAKKIKLAKSHRFASFSSINWESLRRYSYSSHAHYMMFYDVIAKAQDDINILCKTIPTQHLLKVNSINRDIYAYCESFHQLFAYRLAMGYGLDFDSEKVEEAKGFLESSRKFKYLLLSDVSYCNTPTLEPCEIEVNSNIYRSFEFKRPTKSKDSEKENTRSPSAGDYSR